VSKEADTKAGLLGKVAKFIKNPTVDWSDIDRNQQFGSQLSADNAAQSRLALKEMIKRKRHNDLVRKREFDMLRKLRSKGKGGQTDDLDTMALTSTLYSSSQLAQEAEKWDGEQKREWTLRQINEIEAQLSHAWFHKPSDAPTVPMNLRAGQLQSGAAPSAPTARDKGAPGIPASDFRPATPPPMTFESASAPDQSKLPVLTHMYQRQTTHGTAHVPVPRKSAVPQWKDSALNGLTVQTGLDKLIDSPKVPPGSPPLAAHRHEPRRRTANTVDENIKAVALRQDPEIYEAAISFATGHEVISELTLLKLISTGGSRRNDVEVWLTLFDLYRVTGKFEAFDGLVPEFTILFGRSAPQWERECESVPDKIAADQNATLQITREGAFAWASPAQFNTGALTALTNAVERAAPPWRIDWHAVNAVEPDVLPQLNNLFTQWADTSTQLQFLGGEQLLAVLAQQSPTENKNINPVWWRVRLTLLRLMGVPDLFDQVALDYCITYEISPPAWTPPKGSYTPLSTDGPPELLPANAAAPPTLAFTTLAGDLPAATDVFEAALEGEILGSAQQALAVLPQNLAPIHSFELDCRALRRVDFGAAGELLNWSIEQQGQGRTVTFRSVHRLLAAFFSVIGINTAAQVVLRKD